MAVILNCKLNQLHIADFKDEMFINLAKWLS